MFVIGDYDRSRQKFVARRGGYLNSGRQGSGSIHAPSAYPDGTGGVYCIYNVTEGRPQDGWAQIMSLPRRYTLGEDDRLLMEPAGDVESLREEAVELSDIELPANQEVVVDQVRGDAMEIVATIDPGEARYIRLNVLRADDKSEYTAVNFHRDVGKDFANRSWSVRDSMIALDPTFSTIGEQGDINQPQSCFFPYLEGEPLELRIFVDRSIVEVFVNGQSACLTRVYPAGADSVGFSIEARGHRAVCSKLQAWAMERVFL
jgi:beta-fructofuranosidase